MVDAVAATKRERWTDPVQATIGCVIFYYYNIIIFKG